MLNWDETIWCTKCDHENCCRECAYGTTDSQHCKYYKPIGER